MYLNTLRMGSESNNNGSANPFPRNKSGEDDEDLEESNRTKFLDKLAGPKNIRNTQLRGISLLACGIVFMAVMTTLVVEDVITFGYKESDIADFESQFKFVLKFQVLPITWLFISLKLVILRRLRSKAIDPLSGNEQLVNSAKNVFTNSIEQAFISMWIQFVLLAFFTPESLLKYIPLINIFHFIGRVCFFIGYPNYRSFGFSLSCLPPAFALFAVLCKLLGFCNDSNA